VKKAILIGLVSCLPVAIVTGALMLVGYSRAELGLLNIEEAIIEW